MSCMRIIGFAKTLRRLNMSAEITSDEMSIGSLVLAGYISVDEKHYVVAELNGSKREFSVLKSETDFPHVLNWKNPENISLNGRSIVHPSSASLRSMEVGGSVDAGLVYDWGGREGPSWSGKVSAEAHDDRGNYAKVEVKQDSTGKGSATVSAGHKEEGK